MEITKIILAGNPNCGKSSLFNQLTGLKQKITNVPGTTIENKVGRLKVGNVNIELIDTPGTYSFNPKSLDEKEADDKEKRNDKEDKDAEKRREKQF